MATVRDLVRWVRDFVADPHHQSHLMLDAFCWHQLCVAMDTIDDTDSALAAYVDHEFPSDAGEKYLRTYGILQGLFLQQDALVELINAIRPVNNIRPRDLLTDVLVEVRGARNKSVGHPVKLGWKTFSTHSIVQHSMRKNGFELMSYPRQKGETFQSIPVLELIVKQRAEAFRILSEVIEELRVQTEAHRAKFREIKLAHTFDQASYAFEKISEELRPDSLHNMGKWGVGYLLDSLTEFDKQLQARGLSVEAYASIKYLYHDCIEHPLAELRKFLYREPSEIASDKSAMVFADALRSYFDELRRIAIELDQEYASGPQPVIPPERQGSQDTIHVTVTTIGGPREPKPGE